MRNSRHLTITIVFLIFVMFLSLLNVNSVLADDGAPTEPPPAEITDEPTEPPVEATEEPIEATAVPEEPTQPPVATEVPVVATEAPVEEPVEEAAVEEVLAQLPEDAPIVVLDSSGDAVPLATQEATDIILDTDPMWCPAGALPGDPGCTTNFASINALMTDMRNTDMANNPGSTYTQDGVIYFTSSASGTLNLTTALDTTHADNFATISNYNLTLQGGWNGANGGSATFAGLTDFGSSRINIGTSGNPWIGNITINNFTFSNATSAPIRVFTTSGDITLDNIQVVNQSGTSFSGQLTSDSGDITVQNSSFDGNTASQSRGFSATTTSGEITISDTTFQESRRNSASNTYEGAILSAPTITLNNVTAINNDGSGILATNYDELTLNNVIASNNGKDIGAPGLADNQGAGVEAIGNIDSRVIIIGGSFNNNQTYGYEVAESTVYIQLDPISCTGNVGGCTDVPPEEIIFDNTPPELTLPDDISIETTDPAGVPVDYVVSAVDNLEGEVSIECIPPSGSIFPIGTTTVECEATDEAGNTTSGEFDIDITTPGSPDEEGNGEEEPNEGEEDEEGSSGEETTAGEEDEDEEGEDEGDEGEISDPAGDTIPVTGGTLFDIFCPVSIFTQKIEEIQVTLTNLCSDYQGSFDHLDETGLPGALPNGSSFINGLTINVLKDGQLADPLPENANLSISIRIPDNAENKDFAVMFWDGTKWVEVESQQTTDGYFQFTSVVGGTFILIEK